MELSYTRAMIKAVLTGALDKVDYKVEPYFGLSIPTKCPDVPNALLYPRDTWRNEEEYDKVAKDLTERFMVNFEAFKDKATASIINAGPKSVQVV